MTPVVVIYATSLQLANLDTVSALNLGMKVAPEGGSVQLIIRATLYLGSDRTLKIWANRIARFHQIGPKGFILRAGPNTHSSHVAS